MTRYLFAFFAISLLANASELEDDEIVILVHAPAEHFLSPHIPRGIPPLLLIKKEDTLAPTDIEKDRPLREEPDDPCLDLREIIIKKEVINLEQAAELAQEKITETPAEPEPQTLKCLEELAISTLTGSKESDTVTIKTEPDVTQPITIPLLQQRLRQQTYRTNLRLRNTLPQGLVSRIAHQKQIHECRNSDCKRAFATRKEETNHWHRIHEKIARYICKQPECDAKYTTSSSLLVHTLRTHSPKRFSCPYCQRGFGLRGDLTQHVVRRHANKKRWILADSEIKEEKR